MPKFESVILALNAIRGSAARYGIGHATLVRRFFHLYCSRRFSPYEIYFNDLLNPRISDEALQNYMSFDEAIAFDRKHILNAYICMTADKAVFYALCAAACVPIPKLFGVFDQPVGWAPDGRILISRADWHEFLRSLPRDFVIKPALGLQGRGVAAFRREETEFTDHEGHHLNCEELYQFLLERKEANLFGTGYSHHSLHLPQPSHKTIIQERLYAHPSIAQLTGSVGLCTCRLLTHTEPSGESQLLGSAFRVITGDNVVDNLDRGARGNLWCNVEADTGCITEAFVRPNAGDRLELVTRHPTTGRDITGFCIPHWDKTVELARKLASTFRPQPSITWDIGITGEGPVAIEGNVCGQLLPTPLNRPVRTLLAAS